MYLPADARYVPGQDETGAYRELGATSACTPDEPCGG